jgi:uncharacterized protein
MNPERGGDVKTKTMRGGALLTMLLGVGLAPTLLEAQGVVPTRETRTIRVAGVGEARAEPDLATVMFAVETTGATAQEAGRQNAERMDRVIQALMQQGIRREDIRTSGYSLFPEYAQQPRPSDEPPRIRGYRATNQVSVRTTDLERLGRLIDAGLEAGANRLAGVAFELRDARAAQALALQRAVEEARAAAETIAATLGVRLGPVLDASTSAEPPRPFPGPMAMRAEVAMDMAPVTPIEPGEQTVRAMASVVFAIE